MTFADAFPSASTRTIPALMNALPSDPCPMNAPSLSPATTAPCVPGLAPRECCATNDEPPAIAAHSEMEMAACPVACASKMLPRRFVEPMFTCANWTFAPLSMFCGVESVTAVTNGSQGTLTFRRRIRNDTGAPVTRFGVPATVARW